MKAESVQAWLEAYEEQRHYVFLANLPRQCEHEQQDIVGEHLERFAEINIVRDWSTGKCKGRPYAKLSDK